MTDEPEAKAPVVSADVRAPARMPASDRDAARPSGLGAEDQKLAIYLESRITSIVRRESRDPYAGLPADDVLDRLDRRFPDVNYPERMMRRLELEQQNRHELAQQSLANERYEAETERAEVKGSHDIQRQSAKRAVGVLVFLVAVGVACLFTGHEGAGEILLGTTVVGVVGSFVVQQVRSNNS